MAFTSETAAEAGRKSRKGAHKRTKEWLELGEHITGKHAERFNKYLDTAPDDIFAELYLKVLGYFQPKKLHNIHEDNSPRVIEIKNVSKEYKLDQNLNVTKDGTKTEST